MVKKDFIDTCTFSKNEMQYLADLGLKIKEAINHGYYPQLLKGKSLGMIFDQTSTRTRCSAETAMTELGGHALYLAPGQIQLGKNGHEGLADTSHALGDLVDIIGVRTASQEDIVEIAQNSHAPVVNFMSDDDHPTQALGDLITIKEFLPEGKRLSDIKLVFVGDATQITISALFLCAKMGMHFVQYGPKSKWIPRDIYNKANKIAEKNGGSITLSEDESSLQNADFIYTDVWYGLYDHELEKDEYMKIFYPKYHVNDELLAKTGNPNVKFMHCLPANRGEEVSAAVLDGEQSIAWQQAANKKTAMRAVFVYLLNSKFTDMSDSSQKAIKYKYNEELAYLLAQRP
ncbi:MULTISPECIES: ornithine carbamoyltransferase [Lactobacillus]|uniref:ornithine carbamoyltransferase n=1 Tax=Lactobacillus TaxID=1578 RepID=UPI000D701963|nr:MULTISPECIES: ornithine carbamoyltransferase [Lactobacillus]AWN33227.1 ornithine carbamoyltransferase [Lactobacillus helsingborgensis]RMC53691.1 ornithine carbamoyltransferase [Lactobacillus sp. ESL0262]